MLRQTAIFPISDAIPSLYEQVEGIMKKFLSVILIFFGLSVIGIASSMIVFGPHTTGNFFANLLAAVINTPSKMDGLDHANPDSELRFYSAFFLAFGIALVIVGKNLDKYLSWVPVLATIFFIGGCARVFSLIQFGEPHMFFNILMAVELVLPIIILCIWFIVDRASAD